MIEQKKQAGLKFLDELIEQQGFRYVLNHSDARRQVNGPVIYLINDRLNPWDGLALLRMLAHDYNPKLLIDHRSFLYAALKDWYCPLDWDKDIEAQLPRERDSKTAYVAISNRNKPQDIQTVRKIMGLGLKIVPVVVRSSETYTAKALILMQIPGFAKQTKASVVRFGKAISISENATEEETIKAMNFLYARMRALGSATKVKPAITPQARKGEEIIEPIDRQLLKSEINELRKTGGFLFNQAEFDMYVASAWQIPNLSKEIGRLRELTFRDVDEGTMKSLDLDEYDLYYKQLLIWDKEADKIVGGYRLGPGDEIVDAFGKKGFYIHSLFKIKKDFKPYLKQSLELGRSYIVPEYQRKRLPLFLLWKGILHYLLANPQYRYLIGPMSISKHYSNVSRHLIVEFVKRHYYDEDLAKFIRARKQFRYKPKDIDTKLLIDDFDGQLKRLDNFIEDIEPEHFRIPVLMKKYFSQNAKIIGFNLDPEFSDVLDGLMLLDLKNLPNETIESLKE